MKKIEKRGGLRNPPGGRPAMPESEKMRTFPIRFTPEQIKFLKSLNNEKRNQMLKIGRRCKNFGRG